MEPLVQAADRKACPPRRDRHVFFKLPDLKTAKNAAGKLTLPCFAAVADGTNLTPLLKKRRSWASFWIATRALIATTLEVLIVKLENE